MTGVVLVCGGRTYGNRPEERARLAERLGELRAEGRLTALVTGGAPGADRLAEEWAKNNGVPCRVFVAEWTRLGRGAGPARNQRMIDEGQPGLVVAFEGGRGTQDLIRRALRAGVLVEEVF